MCGSSVEVDLALADGVVVDIGLEAQACALGQASAAIVSNNIIGADAPSLYRLRDQMTAMLKSDGPPPDGERWRDLALLASIKDYPQRHASTLLIFNAVCDALDAAASSPSGSMDVNG
ncbi:MAG: iron-sulfur cluster assembly scaffold protein [Pseudomonadota bacterium]